MIMWTYDQFKAKMKRAGWRLSTAQGYYEHKETKKHFNPFNAVRNEAGEMVEKWEDYATRQELPKP